jgi:hypothetical protein
MLPVLSVVASAAFLKARGHATRKHDKEELHKLKEKEDRMREALEVANQNPLCSLGVKKELISHYVSIISLMNHESLCCEL